DADKAAGSIRHVQSAHLFLVGAEADDLRGPKTDLGGPSFESEFQRANKKADGSYEMDQGPGSTHLHFPK
ncbi:MAG TPA: hypothetical protein VL181_00980, partial [Holophagaceae bacterium]|nr:hypothetical protein [Holophagaceae bacterium]